MIYYSVMLGIIWVFCLWICVECERWKGYRRCRIVIKKLYELESFCGYEVWMFMKKDNKVFIYYFVSRLLELFFYMEIVSLCFFKRNIKY